MSEFNIEVPAGGSVRLPTGGKYCDRDIIVESLGKNPVLMNKNISANGTYTPPAGYDGFGTVTVNVPGEYTAFGTMKGYSFSEDDEYEVPFYPWSGRVVVTIRPYTDYESEYEFEFYPYNMERNDDDSIRDTWLCEYLEIRDEKIVIHSQYIDYSHIRSCSIVVAEYTIVG